MTAGPSSGSSRPTSLSTTASASVPTSVSAGEAPIVPTVEAQHLARFEFSDAGTKVLMVEWYPDVILGPATSADPSAGTSDDPSAPAADEVSATDPVSASIPDSNKVDTIYNTSWQVSWPGKSTNLPAAEPEPDLGTEAAPESSPRQRRRRVFFLLPANASVPSTITITPPGTQGFILKPLPAIFPPGLAADPGNRGALHTLWARQRLAALDREVAAELRNNAEGVGVEMALAERQWILETFINPPQLPTDSFPRPAAARSPTGRLGDKLKGLKLATSPADLTPGTTANIFMSPISQSHPFQPRGRDIALSSHEAMVSTASTGPVSLNAALHGDVTTAASAPVRPLRRDDDDDLFALPMSPRSPDMKKSPFSAL
ncbi:hypothetical protein KAF25_001876 [Fusarium avenaceum]|uniref:Uncharacterized protein n=1 Tax=Fusarium avenaceum TaxID=40199 RepID=A0A9P7GUP5_9HYPO|nr:hypothetical protein KAF25_001876 [Fusarium avenaceum]